MPSCWMLASPGDFNLRNAYNDPEEESDFGSNLRLGMKILVVSKFLDPGFDFRHAEFVTEFETTTAVRFKSPHRSEPAP